MIKDAGGNPLPKQYIEVSDICAQVSDLIKDSLRPDAELLFSLIGRRFPWAWVENPGESR